MADNGCASSALHVTTRYESGMPDYRRFRVAGGTYFFTVNLLERKNDLLVRHVDVLRDAVRGVREARPFHIDAWVVLPNHMHCIWTLPEDDVDYSGRWKAIKIRFAKALPPTEYRSRVRRARSERAIWQRRFSAIAPALLYLVHPCTRGNTSSVMTTTTAATSSIATSIP